MPMVTIDPRLHDAVIFDLDGVVTGTAAIHAAAWKKVFDDFLDRRRGVDGEDHHTFTDGDYRHLVDGKPRNRGVADFLACRHVSLPWGNEGDAVEDTVCGIGNRKQAVFLEKLRSGVPVFDSTVSLVFKLADAGIATAVYSSSRNAEAILEAAGLGDLFDVRVDGVIADALGLPGKPDPALLLEAAARLGVAPERTVVVDDAEAGVQAGRLGEFALVVGVDRSGHPGDLFGQGADVVVADLADVRVRTDNTRRSRLPNALDADGRLEGVVGGRDPLVCVNFDGTLAAIASDPDEATLVAGAAEALERLAALCPVVIMSGRDLADLRARVGLAGLWYAGSHGLDVTGPDGSHYHQGNCGTVCFGRKGGHVGHRARYRDLRAGYGRAALAGSPGPVRRDQGRASVCMGAYLGADVHRIRGPYR